MFPAVDFARPCDACDVCDLPTTALDVFECPPGILSVSGTPTTSSDFGFGSAIISAGFSTTASSVSVAELISIGMIWLDLLVEIFSTDLGVKGADLGVKGADFGSGAVTFSLNGASSIGVLLRDSNCGTVSSSAMSSKLLSSFLAFVDSLTKNDPRAIAEPRPPYAEPRAEADARPPPKLLLPLNFLS